MKKQQPSMSIANDNEVGMHTDDNDEGKNKSDKAKRSSKKIPSIPFEDALVLANGIWECASGQKIRRLTLFDHLKKSPDSGPSRALITASSKYGLTTGGYQAY